MAIRLSKSAASCVASHRRGMHRATQRQVLAADAARHVANPLHLAHPIGEPDEGDVPTFMTQGVLDSLELVQVEKDK